MSRIEEYRIFCPICNKETPKMKYCIYCGAKLGDSTIPLREPEPNASGKTMQNKDSVHLSDISQPFSSKKMLNETEKISSDIISTFRRRVSLLGLFQSQEVSENIFQKLHKEYSLKIKEFQNFGEEKLKELKAKIDQTKDQISDIDTKIEELEVRNKLGEIKTDSASQQIEGFKKERSSLIQMIETLNQAIANLENSFASLGSSEIQDLHDKLLSYSDVLKRMVEEKKVSDKTFQQIKPEIDSSIKILEKNKLN